MAPKVRETNKGKAMQAAERKARIATLYLQGKTQADIGKAVGVTQQTVSKHLNSLINAWRQSAIADIDEAKGIELAKINAMEAELYEAWFESKKDRVERSQDTLSRSADQEDPVQDGRKSIRKVSQYGDPRLANGILSCIKQRCDLLGLNAPQKLAATTPDGKAYHGMGLAGLLAEAERLVAEESGEIGRMQPDRKGERRH